MSLTPIGIVDIPHRAFYLSRARGSFVFAVASMDNEISLFDRDLLARPVGGNWQKIRSISLNRSGDLLAVSHGNYLVIVDLDGSPLFRLKEGFDDCFFDPHDDRLWCAAPLSAGQIKVQIRESTNGSVAQEIVIDDPFGGSSCSFHPVPETNTIALWLAAGQEGQQVYWLRRDGELRCVLDTVLGNTTPPDFAPNGGEFLIRSDDNVIRRFQFPDVREIGQCQWPYDDEDDGFGYSLAYIDEKRALLDSNEGQLFVLDLKTMSLLPEVGIPNPFPNPAEYFEGFGDTIVSVHRRDGGWGLEGWKDSLVLYRRLSAAE